ncbi:MAG: tetratricopeptide repeat protein [Bacteroidota bacterium]|nr:tetratricopeptide repeat protein [Bacteroidota bacterium]
MEKKKLTRKDKFNQPTPAKSTITATRKLNYLLPAFILTLLAVVLYGNTLNHDFVLDDYSVILENRLTKQGVSAIPEIFKTSYRYGYYFTDDNLYRPLVKAMYAIEWSLSPGDAFPGHLMNVFFYALTGWVLFFGLIRITGGNVLLAFITTALFIAHPVHTEVVANIKSRDEILAFLFSFMALDQYILALRNGKNKHMVIAALIFFTGFLCKESTITFLAVFPLAGWFFTEEKLSVIFKKMIPLGLVTLLFLLIRMAVLGENTPESVSVADNLLVAAKDPVTRFATTVLILGLYLKILIFPHPLVFDYSFNQIPLAGAGDIGFLVAALVYTALLVFAIIKLKSKNLFSFAILFYLITLSISSNLFITIGSSMGERFLYAPSFGFCFGVALLILMAGRVINESIPHKFPDMLWKNKIVAGLLVIFVAGFSLKTISRNPVWKNNYTLYSNDVLLSPNSTRTHYYLGNYLVKPEAWEGKSENEKNQTLQRGISELKKSIEIYPGFADAHTQMGVAYFKLANNDSAMVSYQRALNLNPGYPTIHNNIGTVYFARQQYPEALQAFLKATQLDPRYSEAHANAGSAYGMMQQYDNALNSLFQAVKWDPNYAQAYYFIGMTYRFKGDQTNANSYLEKSYQMDPSLRPQK